MFRGMALAALTATITLVAATVPAHAQLNPFRRSDFEVTDTDIRLATAAAAKLYEGERAELGDFEDWSNPESGARGSVMLVGIFTHNDLPCRRLQHDIELTTSGTPFRYVFDRCKLPSGEWKLL